MVWAALLGGGGGAGLGLGGIVPDRRDHSVNGASVESHTTPNPILKTHADVNPAGSYNGGGAGNKAILGHFFSAPLLLSALASVEWTVELLAPESVPIGPNVRPYGNLVVEMDPIGAPGVYSILLIGDVANPLPLGTYSVPKPNQFRCVWSAAADQTIVVLLSKMITSSPAPPGTILVAPASGPAPPLVSGSWPSWSFTIASIVAVYPLARIVNAASGDGGLPKSPTITGGLMLICGSSGNFVQNAVRVLDWKLNASPI